MATGTRQELKRKPVKDVVTLLPKRKEQKEQNNKDVEKRNVLRKTIAFGTYTIITLGVVALIVAVGLETIKIIKKIKN